MKSQNIFLLLGALFLQCSHNNLVASEQLKPLTLYSLEDHILFQNIRTEEAYMYVPSHPNYKIFNQFLSTISGINPNAESFNGKTALHYACESNRSDEVSLLLKHDAINPNKQNSEGLTPLFVACKYGNKDLVALLLSNVKTDVEIPNIHGITPAQWIYDNLETLRNGHCILQQLKNKNAQLGTSRNIKNMAYKTSMVCYHAITLGTIIGVAAPAMGLIITLPFDSREAIKWFCNAESFVQCATLGALYGGAMGTLKELEKL